MSIVINTKQTSNANGTTQVVAKGGGKQRTVTSYPQFSTEHNHGLAAGELAQVLGLGWSDGIEHVAVSAGHHRFTFPGVSLKK